MAAGTIGGAISEAAKHPGKTIAETAGMSIASAGLTALTVAELPVISAVALGTGAVLTGQYVFGLIDPSSVHNQERNQAFRNAIDVASTSTDPRTLNRAIEDLQNKTGSDSLQVIEGLYAGGAVRFGFHARGIFEKLPALESRGLQAAFATTTSEQGIPTWQTFSRSSTPTFEEFVNYKAVPNTLRTRPLTSDEAPMTKTQNETAAYRTAKKNNHKADEKETETLPPPQGHDHGDQASRSFYFKDIRNSQKGS